jgi:hypothetical protein
MIEKYKFSLIIHHDDHRHKIAIISLLLAYRAK